VNNVNITNTTVNVTRVTNVYNTVIVNRSTTINNITYVNQRVTNGVTVVSHDAFVNARPVAQNIMRVEPREVVAAPVTRAVAVEPVRTSVIGAGRPVRVRPPTAVISRPVVAVRTPPAPLRSIDQRQAQAGGHLNEQALVKPVAPARPAPTVNQNVRPQPNQEGFRPFGQQNRANNAEESNRVKPMLKPQPRVYEQQGSPMMEENRNVPQQENRMAQPQPNRPVQPENREFRPPQQPVPQETHPLVRPAPPVQQRSPQQEQQQQQKFNQWHEQRQTAPAPQTRPQPSRPEPKQEKPPKK
jgi:hypothetical protein